MALDTRAIHPTFSMPAVFLRLALILKFYINLTMSNLVPAVTDHLCFCAVHIHCDKLFFLWDLIRNFHAEFFVAVELIMLFLLEF